MMRAKTMASWGVGLLWVNLGLTQTTGVLTPEQQQRKAHAELINGVVADKSKTLNMPSDEALKAKMKAGEAERRQQMQAAADGMVRQGGNAFPNVPTPGAGVDIQALAKRYEAKVGAAKPYQDEVYVFISLSMPKASLQNIMKQANRVGANVVLRGFKNGSFKETAAAIAALGVANGASVNPKAFTQYKVGAVPAVILARAGVEQRLDSEGCAMPEDYAGVVGDVTLAYALTEIARTDKRFKLTAERYAKLLGATP